MQVISDFFSQDQLDHLLSLPEIQSTFINEKQHTLNIEVPDDVLTTLNSKLNLNLCSPIPARLIVGDTPAHIDSGATPFDNTYLIYLNDAEGDFIIGGEHYPITANTAFKFAEGMSHEVKSTNGSKRLLLGPMNEIGQQVGGSTIISADGQTETIYFSYISSGPSTGLFYRINNGLLNGVSLPITINNTNTPYTLKVLFETDIVIGSDITYFVAGSDNIQFGSTSLNSDGTRPTFTVDNVINYPGLIKNYDGSSAGYNTIRVLNLQMTGVGTSTLANGNGWVCQAFFGQSATGNLIVNCSTDSLLSINNLSGGIVGGGAGGGSMARLEIIGCTSAGSINGASGGIVGQAAGQDGGTVIVSQCSTSGNITDSGGGIYGPYAGFGGNAFAYTSYSTGTIGTSGGGIFAQYAARAEIPGPFDEGTAIADNCYSTGFIGTNGGGIFGEDSAVGALANKCYSTGQIFTFGGANGGGIFGSSYNGTATDCYTSGPGTAASNGIYAGSGTDNPTGTNNYSEANNGNSGNWNDTRASSRLGTQWISIGTNTPFIFAQIGFTPYQLTNITTDSSGNVFITDFAGTVRAGSTTGPAILPTDYTYVLITVTSGITINSATGAISVAASVTPNTYTLTIYSYINPYSVTTFTLTVDPAVTAATTSVCCGTLAGQSNLNYNTISDVQAGNTFAASLSNPKFRFASYTDYLKYATSRAFRR